ncbi:MAG TPA: DUF2231 domain-containing protein [Mycobacterium sp.]|nr:DUF2231 domain-containing protein [Mycobacterium sp.]
MTVINGLPAHVLFVHFLVVLVPLTALLEIVCGLWPAVRSRLVWLVLVLAVVTTALTPITTNAGEWLYDRQREHSPILVKHADLGGWMIYFSAALLVVAILLAALHIAATRSGTRRPVAAVLVAVLALGVGIASMIQVYRVGDAGARSVWGGELTTSDKP